MRSEKTIQKGENLDNLEYSSINWKIQGEQSID